MSTTVSIAESFQPVPVDLWGHEFETVPLTRARTIEYRAAHEKVVQAELAGDDDALVAAIAATLDARLKIADAKKSTPSKLILKRYEDNDLAVEQLRAFLEDLGRARRGDDPVDAVQELVQTLAGWLADRPT